MSRDRASSNAKRTQRSTPSRVFTEPCVAISCGVSVPEEPTLARVGAFGVLAHDEEVDAVVVTVRSGPERPQVHVQVEREAQPEQEATLEHARRHLGRADGTEQDRVDAAQLVERRRRAARRRCAGSGRRRGRSRRRRARHPPRARRRARRRRPRDRCRRRRSRRPDASRPMLLLPRKNRPRWRGRLRANAGAAFAYGMTMTRAD